MTIHVHDRILMDMTRVSASRLKAKLGVYMRAVRAGQQVVVTDRDEPVARLVPYRSKDLDTDAPPIMKPRDPRAPPLGRLKVASITYRGRSSSEILREERGR